MKIYTRTGDRGTTALIGGSRVAKDNVRVEAYGTVDELNSHLGLLAATPGTDPTAATFLEGIQQHLFDLGALLATPDTSKTDPALLARYTDPTQTERLEAEIDRLTAQIPPQTSFILPAGTQAACQANVARAVCRRAERRLTTLQSALPQSAPLNAASVYLNRLSDYLFTLSRHLNHLAAHPETPWQP